MEFGKDSFGRIVVPSEFSRVLESADIFVPEIFLRKAQDAAKYIAALDQGLVEIDNPVIGRFVTQLGHCGYFQFASDDAREGGYQSPLPVWLENQYAFVRGGSEAWRALDGEGYDEIDALFIKWVEALQLKPENHKAGIYYPAGGRQPERLSDSFKCYVEMTDLLEGLRSGRVQEVLEDLRRSDSLPLDIKLYNKVRLVYYFGDADKDTVFNGFKKYGVNVRGPAQDVIVVRIDEETRELYEDVAVSNDEALKGLRIEDFPKGRAYDPATFFSRYLNLCYCNGKSPSLPFETCFTFLLDPDRQIENKEAAIEEVKSLTRYPVVYSGWRRTNVFR